MAYYSASACAPAKLLLHVATLRRYPDQTPVRTTVKAAFGGQIPSKEYIDYKEYQKLADVGKYRGFRSGALWIRYDLVEPNRVKTSHPFVPVPDGLSKQCHDALSW